MTRLQIVPCSITDARAFVDQNHRHHRAPLSGLFAVGLACGEVVIGVAIIGRPVARALQDGFTAEVTRLATDGTANACSMLYRAAWRAARAMGYRRLVTYTLATERGSSLVGAGFKAVGKVAARSWHTASRPRVDKTPLQEKIRWEMRCLIAAALLIASTSWAVPVPISMIAPTTNADAQGDPYDPCADGSPLTDLEAIIIWAERDGQTDSTMVLTIPALGMEGDTLQAAPDLAPGHSYRIWTRCRDTSGNLSKCRGPELNVAVPPVTAVWESQGDPIVVARLFDVNGRMVTAMPPPQGIYFAYSLTRSGRFERAKWLWIGGRMIRLKAKP